MASKKYSFFAGALCLLASAGFAQTPATTGGSGYDVADSSVVPSRRMPQQNEFMQGTYNFPAKPRSMWEFGLKGGSFMIAGDVAPKFPGFGFGAHIRKALGYVFSLRLNYMYAHGRGLNWKRSNNYYNNQAWTTSGYVPGVEPIYYNYKTRVQDLALEGIITLNNVRFHKSRSSVALYGLFGVGATWFDARVNALNGTTKYNFASITGFNDYSQRKNVRDQLETLLDDTYETPADSERNTRPTLGDNTLIPVVHVGGGIAFRLSRRLNLAIEERYTITRSDLLDGQRWAEQVNGAPVLTPEYDSYNYLTVGLNINIGGKAVEPLWWLNPLDYAYQEIRKPRLMILPKPVLPDSDGDGVTDQFDQEVTPAGCPVDAHGVSLDTDGDGVPDCRDKEKVTPTAWQPVDADGVGKAPCPDSTCFEKYMIRQDDCAVALGAMPSIAFTGGRSSLGNDQTSLLAGVAARLRNSPNCRLTIVSYCTDSKSKQQSGNARAEAVRRYLVEREGISADRITILTGQMGGDCNTIDLRAE